ncbi:MAG: hypothetical protein U9Q81_24440 [Pseudomonadota bacterium]|nr:hypothetical protein [Pseudomonadota bacterium]
MKLAEREKALLKLVDDYREQECRSILDAARAEASDLLRQAYRKERAHLHDRVMAERSRAQSRIQAARAERATRERWLSERTNHDLLDAAWPRLRALLLACWRDGDCRRRWVTGYLRQAVGVLPHGQWTVRHAVEWNEAERRDLAAELEQSIGQAPRFQSDGGVEAGVVIECSGAVLDASLSGLLRDRARLEARLLALLREGARA